MCILIKHIHTTCSHADRDGRSKYNDSSENDVGFIRYCRNALEEADENHEKTKICSGMKKDELSVEWQYVNGMCRTCLEARGFYRSQDEMIKQEEVTGKNMMMKRYLADEAENLAEVENW